jgi:hypothetical protein
MLFWTYPEGGSIRSRIYLEFYGDLEYSYMIRHMDTESVSVAGKSSLRIASQALSQTSPYIRDMFQLIEFNDNDSITSYIFKNETNEYLH